MEQLGFIDLQDSEAEIYRQRYVEAVPVPHVVLDDFLPPHLFNALSNQESQLPALFSSVEFLIFLNRLSAKKEPLIADAYQDQGSVLSLFEAQKIHIDFAKHISLDLDRRIQLVLFIDGKSTSKTGIQFFDPQTREGSVFVQAKANRCVIFDTTDFVPHAQIIDSEDTDPVRVFSRYYYSTGRPQNEMYESVAPRVGDDDGRLPSVKDSIKGVIKQFIPPIAFALKRSIHTNQAQK